MIKYVKGDLITLAEEDNFDAIVQGCNCFCTMGSGIARTIRERYPLAYEIDSLTVAGDIMKLGCWTEYDTSKFVIFNAYTQYGFNKPGELNDVFEYTSFELILQKLATLYGTKNFGFPMIGMGLAGGDKRRIIGQLEWFEELVSTQGGSVTVVEFSG